MTFFKVLNKVLDTVASVWRKLMDSKYRHFTIFMVFAVCLLLIGAANGLSWVKVAGVVLASIYMTLLLRWLAKNPELRHDR